MKIWRKIIGSPIGKGLSLMLITNMLANMLAPSLAMALTGGPSQPEFQGFTEIGVDNMVDPFTGDFSYEIPLMTVPGPNGGYPINLNYSAGIGMEDEASWVGLGWSLNPGAINRNMRGVPDDFSGPQKEGDNVLVDKADGDKIFKSFFTKNNVTVGVGVGITLPPQPPEVVGADFSLKPPSNGLSLSPNANLYYNSYKGVGFRAGVGMKLSTVSNESSSGGLSAALNLNFDSNDGASVQPSLSMSAAAGRGSANVSIGFNYNSRQGVTNTFLNTGYSRKFDLKRTTKAGQTFRAAKTISTGNGLTFAATTGVPPNSTAMFGFNAGFNLDFEAGAFMTHFNIPISFNGMFSVQKVSDWMAFGYQYPAYGTLYSGYRDNDDIQLDRALMDYNREKDWAINMKSPMLPMPVMTHDVYSVTGAGVGGSFRAFRNDAGLFYEPRVASNFLGVTIGVEVAAAPGFKVGVDPTVNFSHSYSGQWKVKDDIEQVSGTNYFRKKSDLTHDGIRTVDPFDFRFTGETTALDARDNRFATLGGNGAGKYTLFPATDDFPDLSETEFEEPKAEEQMSKFFPFKNLGKFKPKASNKMNGQPVMDYHTVRLQKERKIQLVQYRTKSEIQAELTATGQTNHIPDVFNTSTQFNLAQPQIKGHHITEFTILQPGGMRYVYGLPLYNRTQAEFYFAIKPDYPNNGKTVIVPALADLVNMQGKGRHYDKFFTSTVIGPYAHAHLLTHIVSPDYVDLDNNGPSDNDYGYWTKFKYQEIGSYKWRVPLKENEANYIKGYDSNPNDQKGTVTYGERDMTYLHSIETKTHVAVFYVSNRDDAKEVNGVGGGINGASQKMKKLDKIVLFAKNDLNKPIKTVYFEYSYELCEGVQNRNAAASPYTHTVNGVSVTESYSGKLTLKKVYFGYGQSAKGTLTPYSFNYGKIYKNEVGPNAIGLVDDTNYDGNPDYAMLDVDRWGNYKKSIPGGPSNDEVPYVNQSKSMNAYNDRLIAAAAWSLTDITLPTGSRIKIAYESDDYAYVQDRPAAQMYRIAGMGKSTENNHINWLDGSGDEALLTEEYKYVFFELNEQSVSHEDIARMVQQIPDGKLYFKTWQRLQIPKGISDPHWKPDYVTGYAPVETGSGYGIKTRTNGTKYGYLTLKEVTDDNRNWNFFRKSGLQYLRYQRADLGMPQNQGDAALEAAAMILGVIPVIVQAIEMMSGYYNWAIAKNHCKFLRNEKPSFIRLGVPDGIKYGGGNRVRKIVISDAWDELSGESASAYGLEYFYHTTDENGKKISSGVASYEPLIGGEENPMRKSHYYGPDSKFIHNDPAFYLEEPFGESYFPAPVVGYSKMTAVNLANRKNVKTGDGIKVHEFYTARDFPIKATYTQQPQRIEDKQTVFIPLIASITLKGYGYSQGYCVELNDMHGKPKSESVHDADYWNVQTNDWHPIQGDLPYITKKIYKYKANGKQLDNNVEVLDRDRSVRTAVMGESSEMFSEMKEDFGYALSAGAQINGGVDPVPYGIFFSAFPNFEYNENSARTLVTTKVIYRNGILDEVLEMSEGAVKKTRNLLFDPETGAPLLTAVTSDYDNSQTDTDDQSIYNYTYPAYWNYSGTQAAYRNYRNAYKFTGSSIFPNADKYFERGDELVSANGKVWVNSASATSVSLVDASGNLVTPVGTYVTVRSGKRNLQTVPSGSLVSLKNPVTSELHNALLDYYNSNIYNKPGYASSICTTPFTLRMRGVADCADPSVVYSGSIYSNCGNSPSNLGNAIVFTYNSSAGNDCQLVIPVTLIGSAFIPSKARFTYVNPTQILLTYTQPSGQTENFNITVDQKCKLNACMEDILHATADEFSDNWLYDSEFAPANANFNNLNKYLKGQSGIWRKLRTNAYFSDRKQRSTGNLPGVYNTYIGRDGTYERFLPFDWGTGNKDNVQAPYGWRWQAEVTPTGYSPYGYEIENRNAMNIYSAELYGYKNSMVTATAQNAAYPEIGYDGFEEITAGQPYAKTGHFEISTAGTTATLAVSNAESHSGNQSLKVTAGSNGWAYMNVPVQNAYTNLVRNGKLEMLKGRKYVTSFWYKFEGSPTAPTVEVLIKNAGSGGSYLQTHMVNTASPAIEGWRRAEVVFDINNLAPAQLELDIIPKAGTTLYIDDLRIHPSDATFKSFVYDPRNFLLRATLDDNNYATFYNYDEENTLIQVKKETAEGIRTIQTTRKNVKILPLQ